MVDVSTKAIVQEASLDYWPMQIAYTPDGRSIAHYGGHSDDTNRVNPVPIIELRDARTLQPLWKQALTDIQDGRYLKPSEDPNDYEAGTWMMPGVVFSDDGSKLYIVHAGEDKLTTVDLTSRSVSSAAILPPQAFLDWLVGLTAQRAYAKMLNGTEKQAYLSPDGTRLYVIGRTYKSTNTNGQIDMDVTPLGLQVIDTATGTELHHREDIEAIDLTLSPDGKRLYVHGWTDSTGGGLPWTKIYDANSLEELGGDTHATIEEVASLDG
jgi:DNA-binding beta-propeller fold protein YncE